MAFREYGVILCLYLLLQCSSQSQNKDYSDDEETMYNSENIIKSQDEEEAINNDLSCPTPDPPLNGYIVGTNYDLAASVSFHCNTGYRLIGPTEMTCIAIPSPWKRSVMWDPNTERQCEAIEESDDSDNTNQRSEDDEVSTQQNDMFIVQDNNIPDQQVLSTEEKKGEEYMYNHINVNPVPYGNIQDTALSQFDMLERDSSRKENFQNTLESSNTKYEYSAKHSRHSVDYGRNSDGDRKMKIHNFEIRKIETGHFPEMPPFAPEMIESQKDTELPDMREDMPHYCFLQPDPGTCADHVLRYFFDASSGECDEFVYGGCNGNMNNFETLEECDKMC